jgi:hypothetical protein
MQVTVTWSNGMISYVDVPAPEGAVPLSAHLDILRHETALRQQRDGRWECYSMKPAGGTVGYCLSEQMATLVANGHPIEGLSWMDIWTQPEHQSLATVLSRCPWMDENGWERDRLLRMANKSKFHFSGHATEDEAIDCYQRFLADFGQEELGPSEPPEIVRNETSFS